MTHKTLYWTKVRAQRIHTIWFNLYETLQEANLIYGDRKYIHDCLELRVVGMEYEKSMKESGGNGGWQKGFLSWLWWRLHVQL